MKVKIIKCSNDSWWYKKWIGETVIVTEDTDDKNDWEYAKNRNILKSDCIVIEEPKELKKTTDTYEQAKEEVKSCNTCKFEIDEERCSAKGLCPSYELWTPKLADEKPKVEKSCNNCANSGFNNETGIYCSLDCDDNYSCWVKHIPDVGKKVKKYKYICKMCDSGKCVLIVHDTAKSSPSRFDYCPMGGDAKWKLKGEV
jgi:hypothetical protein